MNQARNLSQRRNSLLAVSPDCQMFPSFSRASQVYSGGSAYPVPATAARAEWESCDQENRHSGRLDARDESDERYLLAAHAYAVSSATSKSTSPQDIHPSRRNVFPFHLVSPRRRSKAISERLTKDDWQGVTSIPEEEDDSSTGVNTTLQVESSVTNTVKDVSEVSTKQTPPFNRFSLPSELGSISREATPTRQRASHRQARLIDGALFDGKTRNGASVEGATLTIASEVKHSPKNEAKMLSGHFTAQHTKGSWLRNVWTRFHGEYRRNSTNPKLRKQHSSLTSCGLVGSPLSSKYLASQPAASTIAEMKQTTPTPRFGLDGACEEHLNKPLPLSPGDLKRPSVHSDIHRTFFGRSPKPILNSPEVTTLPTTQRFFMPGQEVDLSLLVSATMSGPQELSSREKSWKYRFSDSSLRSGPLS